MTLTEFLQAYSPTLLPMHMPGGKRRFPSALPYALDVTEVDGLDDLHDPHGLLADVQASARALFGAEASFLLVNGSTGGLLAAIRAAGNGKLLLARNCHRAVFNAATLCRRETTFLLPEPNGRVTPQAVENHLRADPALRTVVVTSPTYEGICSDVKGISAVCRSHGAVLIVDQAHGAHFGLHPAFPPSAVQDGADIVVQSLHKTLPALTQTAILHAKQPWAAALQRENAVFETSSPSYILLASADECIRFLASDAGKAQMNAYADALIAVRTRLRASLRFLSLCDDSSSVAGDGVRDPSKLLLSTRGANCSGKSLADALRSRFAIETEMSTPDTLLAMTSVCDTARELNRFADAVEQLDAECTSPPHPSAPVPAFLLPPRAFLPYERYGEQGEPCPLQESVGRVAAEAVWAYPPGICLLQSGEYVTDELVNLASRYADAGLSLHSTSGALAKEGVLAVFPDESLKNAAKKGLTNTPDGVIMINE